MPSGEDGRKGFAAETRRSRGGRGHGPPSERRTPCEAVRGGAGECRVAPTPHAQRLDCGNGDNEGHESRVTFERRTPCQAGTSDREWDAGPGDRLGLRL